MVIGVFKMVCTVSSLAMGMSLTLMMVRVTVPVDTPPLSSLTR